MFDYVDLHNQHLFPTNDFPLQFLQEIHINAKAISSVLIDFVCQYEWLMFHLIFLKMLLLHFLE